MFNMSSKFFSHFLDNQLYIKSKKSKFHISTISFLGYIIGPEGVAKNEAKVAAATEWPTPKTSQMLQL